VVLLSFLLVYHYSDVLRRKVSEIRLKSLSLQLELHFLPFLEKFLTYWDFPTVVVEVVLVAAPIADDRTMVVAAVAAVSHLDHLVSTVAVVVVLVAAFAVFPALVVASVAFEDLALNVADPTVAVVVEEVFVFPHLLVVIVVQIVVSTLVAVGNPYAAAVLVVPVAVVAAVVAVVADDPLFLGHIAQLFVHQHYLVVALALPILVVVVHIVAVAILDLGQVVHVAVHIAVAFGQAIHNLDPDFAVVAYPILPAEGIVLLTVAAAPNTVAMDHPSEPLAQYLQLQLAEVAVAVAAFAVAHLD
jgi:hypothetical protein